MSNMHMIAERARYNHPKMKLLNAELLFSGAILLYFTSKLYGYIPNSSLDVAMQQTIDGVGLAALVTGSIDIFSSYKRQKERAEYRKLEQKVGKMRELRIV